MGPTVFAPAEFEGEVVTRPWVFVEAEPAAARVAACHAAWDRWRTIDLDGVESPGWGADPDAMVGLPRPEGVGTVLGLCPDGHDPATGAQAVTALRILVEELGRAGCSGVSVVDATPGAPGLDLQVRAALPPPVRPVVSGVRPDWLPPERTFTWVRTPGLPAGPSPLAFVSNNHVGCLDGRGGVVSLPEPASPKFLSRGYYGGGLTPDGTTVYYQARCDVPVDTIESNALMALDLVTGERTPSGYSDLDSLYFSRSGYRLLVRCQPWHTGDHAATYHLLDPTGDEVGVSVGVRPSSDMTPAVQVSHHGTQYLRTNRECVELVDRVGAVLRAYSRYSFSSASAWCPCGKHIVLYNLDAFSPEVINLATGEVHEINGHAHLERRPSHYGAAEPVAWVGCEGLIMRQERGTQGPGLLSYQLIDNSGRWPLVHLPAGTFSVATALFEDWILTAD